MPHGGSQNVPPDAALDAEARKAVAAADAAAVAAPRGVHGAAIRAGLAGAAVGAVFRTSMSLANGEHGMGLAEQALRGGGGRVGCRRGDGFSNIRNAPTKVDAFLNSLDTATSAAATTGVVFAPVNGRRHTGGSGRSRCCKFGCAGS